MGRRTFLHPRPIPRSNRSQTPYMGSKWLRFFRVIHCLIKNQLHFGDNLEILRNHVADASVDLIYLDPPFNANANYNVLFQEKGGQQSAAQITAFEDTWHWSLDSESAYQDVVTNATGKLPDLLQAMRSFLGDNDMMAYLTMMAQRMVELHCVLKDTGSIYLHCDPTASHYLKLLMDSVFTPGAFRNDIIWKRTSGHNDARRCGSVHDDLLFYTKSNTYTWNRVNQEYDPAYVERYYRYVDADGRRFMSSDLSGAGPGPARTFGDQGTISPPNNRHWMYDQVGIDRMLREDRIFWTRNKIPRLKVYLDESAGLALQDVWNDVQALRPAGRQRAASGSRPNPPIPHQGKHTTRRAGPTPKPSTTWSQSR